MRFLYRAFYLNFIYFLVLFCLRWLVVRGLAVWGVSSDDDAGPGGRAQGVEIPTAQSCQRRGSPQSPITAERVCEGNVEEKQDNTHTHPAQAHTERGPGAGVDRAGRLMKPLLAPGSCVKVNRGSR